MKLFVITIVSFALAIWLGVCAGHMADRHFKPFKPQIEQSGEITGRDLLWQAAK